MHVPARGRRAVSRPRHAPTTRTPPRPTPARRRSRLPGSRARPRIYYKWTDAAGVVHVGHDPRREGVVYTHDPRPGLENARMTRSLAQRPVRPGPLPHPLQQGQGLLRRAALRGGRARAGGGLPAAAAGPEGPEPPGPRLLQAGEVREGRGGLPQAGGGEPRGPHALLQPRPHPLQAEPAGGGGVRLPEGPGAGPRTTPRSTSTWAPSTSGCTASRTRSTSTARPARTSWCAGSRTRWRPRRRRPAPPTTATSRARRRPRSPKTPRSSRPDEVLDAIGRIRTDTLSRPGRRCSR